MKKTIVWIGLGSLGILLFTAFLVSIVILVMKMMKGEAYDLSLSAVSENPKVIAIVGKPVTPSWYVLGSVNTSGPNGSASLEYSIEGPASSGKVYAYATKAAGNWTLNEVIFSAPSSGEEVIVIEGQE